MKKAMIALSAILVAAPVFAATTHATDDTVAAATANANTAKEKLHQAQHEGEEQQLKAKHAAEGKQDSVDSQMSEGANTCSRSRSTSKALKRASAALAAPDSPMK